MLGGQGLPQTPDTVCASIARRIAQSGATGQTSGAQRPAPETVPQMLRSPVVHASCVRGAVLSAQPFTIPPF